MSDNGIRTNWIGYFTSNQCPLCLQTGENIATHAKKGHRRSTGVILEWSLAFCEACWTERPIDCEAKFQEEWTKQWDEANQQADKNYEKWGCRSAVGYGFGVSRYFGYAKDESGNWVPYLSLYPDCKRHKLDTATNRIYYSKPKAEILDFIANFDVDEDYKKIYSEAANKYYDWKENWEAKNGTIGSR